jgi:hypothetical protein
MSVLFLGLALSWNIKKNILKKALIIGSSILFLFFNLHSNAQQTRQSGWAMYMKTFKLNEKFIFFFDAQLRSNDNWIHPEKFIFRPSIGYTINKQTTISLGYPVVTNWRELLYVSPVDPDKIVRVGVYARDSST